MIQQLRLQATSDEVSFRQLEFPACGGHVVEVLGADVGVVFHQLAVAALFGQPVDVFLVAAAEDLAGAVADHLEGGFLGTLFVVSYM